MSTDVKYDQDTHLVTRVSQRFASPKIVQWLMRYSAGTIKNERTAVAVILCFVAILIVVAIAYISLGAQSPPRLQQHHLIKQ